jgi:V-type H+-transporting ATPase subunit a
VGVIAKEDEQRFKRTIFRMTKGNAWVNIMDIVAGENQEALVDIDEVISTHQIRIR